ncbi:MAG TPA: NADH-ubiquinone oxidoreductase-F iron-sulfur binding region domain-containing protein [Nitrospinota bacterium]|nr:NADH-ubiquinone oxidoreductase-F iron-sulfur binding region domain-containing protein [Nitrospinota bacterium]
MNNSSGQRILLSNDIPMSEFHSIATLSIDEYISKGGYKGLSKAISELKPADIIEEVKKAGLRGRGGAGFSTGKKWEIVDSSTGDKKYVCCNVAEGEPNTFKDRSLIRSNPHQLIEGITIASYSVGANDAYIYINEKYTEETAILEKGLRDAKEKGYLGEEILGSKFSLNIEIKKCPDKYVTGEETAMMEIIEGWSAKPRQKPPFYPSSRGLHGNPTLVNNAETLSNIPHIILKGGDWFSKIGSPKSPGTMVFTLSGDVKRPGIYELPMGTPLRKIIYDCGKGLNDGMVFKAVFPGGPSNSPVTEAQLDTLLDFDSLRDIGSGLGSATVIVLGDSTCIVNTVLKFSRFFMEESCGQCPPCQMGTVKLFRLIKKVEDGNGDMSDLKDIEDTCSLLKNQSVYCHLLMGATLSVEGAVKNFRSEFETHINEKKCIYKSEDILATI